MTAASLFFPAASHPASITRSPTTIAAAVVLAPSVPGPISSAFPSPQIFSPAAASSEQPSDTPTGPTAGVVLGTSTEVAYVTQGELQAALAQLQSSINYQLYSSTSTYASGGAWNGIAATNRIDNLSGSSQGPITISDATFTNVSGLTAAEIPALSSLNGLLGVSQGGTGTSTAPSANEVLLSDANGNWEYVATSSLGILSGQWTTTGSTVSYTGGSVVIGTTTANHEFDVWGVSNTPIGITTGDPTLTVTNAGQTIGNGSSVAFQGVDSAGNEITLARLSDVSTSLTPGAASGNLDFFTRNAGTQQQDLTILAGGNVGIGTTTPSTVLSVNGPLSVSDNGSSSVAQLGSELTTDGSFTTNPSGSWTLGSGWTWDSTNDRAEYTGSGGPIASGLAQDSIEIANGGSGYTSGNTVTIACGSDDATYTVTASSGKVGTLTQVSGGTTYTSGNTCATTGGSGTGLTVFIAYVANGAALSETIPLASTPTELVTFTIANYSAGAIENTGFYTAFGSNFTSAAQYYKANGTYQLVLTASTTLSFTPTDDFSGEITNISVKPITSPLAVQSVNNTDSSTGLQLRPGGIGLQNSFIGVDAGESNTTGNQQTAFGYDVLAANTTGTENTALGYQALTDNTTGGSNTAIGYGGLEFNTTGIRNTATGIFALLYNQSGSENTAYGYNSDGNSTAGSFDTAYGYDSLNGNLTGTDNTGLGANSLFADYNGQGNIAVGYDALLADTSGGFDIGIGYRVGQSTLSTGSYNILIGQSVDLASSSISQELDVGNVLFGSGLYNGSTASSVPTTAGKIAVGTSTPYARLSVWGIDAASSTLALNVVNSASTTVFSVFDGGNAELSGTLTQSSDERLKTNIQSLDASDTLALIDELNPVTFNWIDPNQSNGTQVGFIAQQVQQIFPELVSTTSATALTPGGTLGLNYIGLISPIVSAIQALSGEVQNLVATVQGFAQSFTSNTITFNDQLCAKESDGNAICITGDQLAALLAAEGQQGSSPPVQITDGTTTISAVSTTTPPTITINGNNPAVIEVGDGYDDLGVTVSDVGPGQAGDTNLGYQTFLNGTLVSNIVLDTNQVATDTIDYVATDSDGLTATSTRTVIIEATTVASSTAQ